VLPRLGDDRGCARLVLLPAARQRGARRGGSGRAARAGCEPLGRPPLPRLGHRHDPPFRPPGHYPRPVEGGAGGRLAGEDELAHGGASAVNASVSASSQATRSSPISTRAGVLLGRERQLGHDLVEVALGLDQRQADPLAGDGGAASPIADDASSRAPIASIRGRSCRHGPRGGPSGRGRRVRCRGAWHSLRGDDGWRRPVRPGAAAYRNRRVRPSPRYPRADPSMRRHDATRTTARTRRLTTIPRLGSAPAAAVATIPPTGGLRPGGEEPARGRFGRSRRVTERFESASSGPARGIAPPGCHPRTQRPRSRRSPSAPPTGAGRRGRARNADPSAHQRLPRPSAATPRRSG
jgi:hypothetical protein